MKKRWDYVDLIILRVFFFIVGLAIFGYRHIQHSKGTTGNAENINDIPFVSSDFEGLNIIGPIEYAYKIFYRNMRYMITAKTTEDSFLSFCDPDKGWNVNYISGTDDWSWIYKDLNISPSEFPWNSEGEILSASIYIQAPKSTKYVDIEVFFRKEDQTFLACVCLDGYRSTK